MNIRSFGHDALWGSIGGYVGMLIGISVFELPDIIYSGFQFSRYLIRVLDKKLHSKINDAEPSD